jgi:hypothetical protein
MWAQGFNAINATELPYALNTSLTYYQVRAPHRSSSRMLTWRRCGTAASGHSMKGRKALHGSTIS